MYKSCVRTAAIFAFTATLCHLGFGQKKSDEPAVLIVSPPAAVGGASVDSTRSAMLPKVKQVDMAGLRKLLKTNGRPLLINFWATWCPPCTEEFPDLVKLNAEFKGKVDFITVSMDDLADIETFVPKFLEDMRSEMPAYLLHTADESAAITVVSKDWSGNIPMTVLYDSSGHLTYSRNGKIRLEPLRENILKLLPMERSK